MITTKGKNVILRYLGGQTSSIGGSLAAGAGSTAAVVGDTRLTFEIERATVDVTSIDFINQRVIFKGTFPQTSVGTIYEIGLYTSETSSSTLLDSRRILSFQNGLEAWTTGTFGAFSSRAGADSLRLSPAASATVTSVLDPIILDLSTYSTIDQFNLAINASSNTASIRIRFRGVDSTSYYEFTTTSIAIGYNTINFTKGNTTKTGTNVDWSDIRSVEISATATAGGVANVDFDAMRIEDVDNPSMENILVARKVLDTPQVKTSTAPMDIEFALDFII